MTLVSYNPWRQTFSCGPNQLYWGQESIWCQSSSFFWAQEGSFSFAVSLPGSLWRTRWPMVLLIAFHSEELLCTRGPIVLNFPPWNKINSFGESFTDPSLLANFLSTVGGTWETGGLWSWWLPLLSYLCKDRCTEVRAVGGPVLSIATSEIQPPPYEQGLSAGSMPTSSLHTHQGFSLFLSLRVEGSKKCYHLLQVRYHASQLGAQGRGSHVDLATSARSFHHAELGKSGGEGAGHGPDPTDPWYSCWD